MSFNMAINTGFAVNRYPEAEDWCEVIKSAGAKNVQLTADIVNPSLPDSIVARKLDEIIEQCENHGLSVTSTFTGAFTRVNHLAHPDGQIRRYWVGWFKKFADMTAKVGAKRMGSHFGIFSMKDDRDPDLRKARLAQNISGWHEIADYAASVGIEQVLWEPMSISREQGETLAACRELQDRVNNNAPLPFGICLDLDHGDVSSPNKDDTDPYVWLREFCKEAPMIHLKQSSENKSGHWPFTAEFNSIGRIKPDKVTKVLLDQGVSDTELVLELSFREREPADRSAPAALRESVDYWRPYVSL